MRDRTPLARVRIPLRLRATKSADTIRYPPSTCRADGGGGGGGASRSESRGRAARRERTARNLVRGERNKLVPARVDLQKLGVVGAVALVAAGLLLLVPGTLLAQYFFHDDSFFYVKTAYNVSRG